MAPPLSQDSCRGGCLLGEGWLDITRERQGEKKKLWRQRRLGMGGGEAIWKGWDTIYGHEARDV